jgi:diguanylate cyclase (GGDEF)-like protein
VSFSITGNWRGWPTIGLLCLFLGVAVAQSAAETPPIVLEHLTTADGLPQGTVHVVLQDSQGFIWLGTEDGLVRYDGHELFRYAYSPKAQGGLPGSFIQAIVEDAHHDLWIAVKDAGLARWNRATDRFTVYRHDRARPTSLGSDAVNSLLIDARGLIWVGSSTAGIDVLDPTTGRVEHRTHDPSRADSLTDNRVTTLGTDRSGRTWVGTLGGLDLVESGGETFAHYRHLASDPNSLSSDEISDLYEDRAGSLWIGTYDAGLNQMDHNGRVTQIFRHDSKNAATLQHDDVRAILEDAAGHLWVATADGLDLLNRATGRFVHYRHDDHDARSLNDSEVMSLYEDAGGLVWIGTRTGGVDRWNPRSWELGGYRPDWLAGRPVTAFADGPDQKIWVGSLGKGLVLFDPATGESIDSDKIIGRPNAIGDQRVMSLRLDRGGRLWIGTRDHGLSMLSSDGRVTTIPVKPGDPRSLSAAGIMAIFEAKDGKIWIGTHGGGANVVDPITGLVRQLPYDAVIPGATSSPNVDSFAEDLNGNLWIGNDGAGLDLARPDGTVIKSFRHNPDDPMSLSANGVYDIAVDPAGRVWVATDSGGLNLIHGSSSTPDSINFENLSRAEGLSSDTIYSVLVDPAGRLWMSGNSGLMRYDPRTRAVKTFHVEQGLQSEEFESGAFLKLRDGRFCFGGPSGFNIFDPSNLTELSRPPRLALMQLEVLGVPVESTTPYWLLDRIAVGAGASIISLDFGTLDFTSPKRTRLAYRLPGLSDQWIDLGTQHRVTLTNLDAGDHVLEVRAANADSAWSETPLRIKIHRNPPSWRSLWAYLSYIAGALGLIAYGLWRRRRKFQAGLQAQAERTAAAAHIERLAYFDPLTGLPNRQRCIETAERFVSQAAKSNESVAFIYMDLNGFKRINDTFGHAVGDAVLRTVSEKIAQSLETLHGDVARPVLARFGGDEFVILLKSPDARAVAIQTANTCYAGLKDPISHGGLEFHATPSIGLAVYPDDGPDVATVLKHADTAMYQAKTAGAVSAAVYVPAMSGRLRDWLDLETRLRRAVRQDGLHLHFQPKFRMDDNQISGVEALLRWCDSDYGDISPGRFVPIAEESGLIIDMGSWVVRAACRQIRAWLDRGVRMPVAINVSGKELLHGDPARVVEAELAALRIPASLLEIEITESLLIKDSRTVRNALDRFRSLGCKIALDDFGTGYSSFAYITRFPPDCIKIDKSFVRNVDQSPADAAVANAILSLGKSLKLVVIAEGIERVGQLEWLRQRGCDEGQGFLLSRPLAPRALEDQFLFRQTEPDSGNLATKKA